MRNFNDKVIQEFGETGYGRWLLSDGRMTFERNSMDHRAMGAVIDPWYRAITEEGAISLSYSREGLYIRFCKKATAAQADVLRDIVTEDHELVIEQCDHNFDRVREKVFCPWDNQLGLLMICDPIAYRLEVDSDEEDDE